MKVRILLALTLMFVALSAAADDLKFVRMATDLWQTQSTDSLNKTFAIVVRLPEQENLGSDKDLAPFVSAAKRAAETMFVLIISEKGEPKIAMYFRDEEATFFTVGKGSRARVPAKIPAGKEKLLIEPGELTADDDTPLDAWEITVPGSAEI
jgi:hypothetical protein